MTLCPSCPKEVAVRRDGTIRQHQRPSSPRRFGHPPCQGSGLHPAVPRRDPQMLADAAAAVADTEQAIRDAAASAGTARTASTLQAIADEIASHHCQSCDGRSCPDAD